MMVNWCLASGVLANDEVKDGFSERGGHPVERKLINGDEIARITAYADRLLRNDKNLDLVRFYEIDAGKLDWEINRLRVGFQRENILR